MTLKKLALAVAAVAAMAFTSVAEDITADVRAKGLTPKIELVEGAPHSTLGVNNLFDGNSVTAGRFLAEKAPVAVSYELPSGYGKRFLTAYAFHQLVADYNFSRSPMAWTLSAWDESIENWVVIDERSFTSEDCPWTLRGTDDHEGNADMKDVKVTWTIASDKNVMASKFMIEFTANNGNKESYSIGLGDMDLIGQDSILLVDIPEQKFDGRNPVCPVPTVSDMRTGEVLQLDEDYTYALSDNDRVGTGICTVTGKNAYAGHAKAQPFEIKSAYGEGTVVFVTPTGDPAADGSSWENATTLAHACEIVPAGTASEYNTIVLEAGTVEGPAVYDLSASGANPKDAESVLCLPVNYVILRSEDEACDPRKIVVKGGYEAQSLRLLKVQGALQVSGITFEDFYTTTNGGVLDNTSNKSLIVSKCVFLHNYAETAGGALRLASDGATTGKALDCTFVSNRCVTVRGGSAVRGGLVTNCCFRAQAGGWATSYGQVFDSDYIENLGGVFYCCNATDCEIISNRYVDANGTINACTIMHRNTGVDGGSYKMLRCHSFANRAAEQTSGGGYFGLTDTDTCEDCTFDSDEGSSDARGHCNITLKNCTFTGYANTIRTITYDATITGCTFTNNFAQIFMGGTISKSYIVGNCCETGKLYTGPQGEVSTVTDCLFASNKYYSIIDPYTAGTGNDRFYNCTFADNTVSAEASVIASGFNDGSPAKLVNCLLYGNSGYDFRTSKSNITASNCLYQTVKGTFDPTLSGGNIVATRAAFSRESDELHPYGYRPKSSSEARDAGLDVGRGGEGDTDLTTVTPRVIGPAIDIGCYEYEPLNGLMFILR